MGTSVLHIKTEVECRVYLFDEEKGIAKPGTYFNLEVRKGEQDLLFVSTEDETVRYQMSYRVEDNGYDYCLLIDQSFFVHYSKEVMELLQKAESGNVTAQCNLAECYYNGRGIRQDYSEAITLWMKSAEKGDTCAMNNLGWCYLNGKAVEKDLSKMEKWWLKAAEKGNAVAQVNLLNYYAEIGERLYKVEYKWGGRMDYLGMGSDFFYGITSYLNYYNYTEMYNWYIVVAEKGSTLALRLLAECYLHGRGVEKDKGEALKWYRMSAEKGDTTAQRYLYRYYGYWYVRRRYSSIPLVRRSENFLFEYFDSYLPTQLNCDEAIKWCLMAVEKGDADAAWTLGMWYERGDGVQRNKEISKKWFYRAVELYRKYAERGDADAQLSLAECYVMGMGLLQDNVEAVKWYQEAANHGNRTAMYVLGFCYLDGIGVSQNDSEAVKWWRLLAEMGDKDGKDRLGECFYYGIGVERNYEEADKLWESNSDDDYNPPIGWINWDKERIDRCQKLAEQGDVHAMLDLAFKYRCYGFWKDLSESVKWYRKAAEMGSAGAMHCLSILYEKGEGVEKNNVEARKWYDKYNECELKKWKQLLFHAEQGDAESQLELGKYYEEDGHVDEIEAVKWYRKSANQNNAEAQYRLGLCFMNGKGIQKNVIEAGKLFCKAGEQGQKGALNELENIGYNYQHGIDVEKDYATALKYYEKSGSSIVAKYIYGGKIDNIEEFKYWYKAAYQGNAYAQYNIGAYYYWGIVVEKDFEIAVNWYKKAAVQGHVLAQYYLGWCLAMGKGIEKNEREAINWWRKALKNGDEMANNNLMIIEETIPTDSVK